MSSRSTKQENPNHVGYWNPVAMMVQLQDEKTVNCRFIQRHQTEDGPFVSHWRPSNEAF